jgi:hypothetical protein
MRVMQFEWKLWTIGSFVLRHDNALAHTALSVREFLAISAVPCFCRLLVLQICHLVVLLVPKIKIESQGLSFQTLDSVQKAVTDAIKTLTEVDFQSC